MSLVTLHPTPTYAYDLLLTAVNSVYRVQYGRKFLEDSLARGMEFTRGTGTTSGEVSTSLVAIADQMLLLSHQNIQNEFKTSKFKVNVKWDITELDRDDPVGIEPQFEKLHSRNRLHMFYRHLFVRIIRDKMDDLFTAFVNPNDANAEQLRHQKDLDSELLIEILVQGLNDAKYDNSKSHVMGDGFQSPVTFDVDKLLQQRADSKAVSVKGATSCGDVNADANDNDDEDGEVSFGDFFEEPALEDLTNSNNHPSLLNNAVPSLLIEATAAVEESKAGDSQDSIDVYSEIFGPTNSIRNIQQVLSNLFAIFHTLPRRNPKTEVSSESLKHTSYDTLRVNIIESILLSVRHELQVAINSYKHIQYQQAYGNIDVSALSDDPKNISLIEILGLSSFSKSDIFLWFLTRIICCIKCRQNSLFRNDQVTLGHSLFQMSFENILTKMNNIYTTKQTNEYIRLEEIRRKGIYDHYRRLYLCHVTKKSPLPLYIYGERHLKSINVWCMQHRGYEVIRSTSPITGNYTGMAKNTILYLHSPYFMVKVNPFSVLNEMFGGGETRDESIFANHLHTTSKDIFADIMSKITNNEIVKNESFAQFQDRLSCHYGVKKRIPEISLQLFLNYLLLQYEMTMIDVDTTPLTSLSIVALTLSVEEFVFSYFKDINNGTTSDGGNSGTLKSSLHEMILSEISWFYEPDAFLTRYFNQIDDGNASKLTLTEFLDHVRAISEEEVELATNAFHQKILIK